MASGDQPSDGPKRSWDDVAVGINQQTEKEQARRQQGKQQHEQKMENNRQDRADRAAALQAPRPAERLQNAQLEERIRPAGQQQGGYAQIYNERARQKLEAERERTRQDDLAIAKGEKPTPEKAINRIEPPKSGPSR